MQSVIIGASGMSNGMKRARKGAYAVREGRLTIWDMAGLLLRNCVTLAGAVSSLQ